MVEIQLTKDLKDIEVCSIKYQNEHFKEYADFVRCINLVHNNTHKDCFNCHIWINWVEKGTYKGKGGE